VAGPRSGLAAARSVAWRVGDSPLHPTQAVSAARLAAAAVTGKRANLRTPGTTTHAMRHRCRITIPPTHCKRRTDDPPLTGSDGGHGVSHFAALGTIPARPSKAGAMPTFSRPEAHCTVGWASCTCARRAHLGPAARTGAALVAAQAAAHAVATARHVTKAVKSTPPQLWGPSAVVLTTTPRQRSVRSHVRLHGAGGGSARARG